jgi:hypothetical protein
METALAPQAKQGPGSPPWWQASRTQPAGHEDMHGPHPRTAPKHSRGPHMRTSPDPPYPLYHRPSHTGHRPWWWGWCSRCPWSLRPTPCATCVGGRCEGVRKHFTSERNAPIAPGPPRMGSTRTGHGREVEVGSEPHAPPPRGLKCEPSIWAPKGLAPVAQHLALPAVPVAHDPQPNRPTRPPPRPAPLPLLPAD